MPGTIRMSPISAGGSARSVYSTSKESQVGPAMTQSSRSPSRSDWMAYSHLSKTLPEKLP